MKVFEWLLKANENELSTHFGDTYMKMGIYTQVDRALLAEQILFYHHEHLIHSNSRAYAVFFITFFIIMYTSYVIIVESLL